MSIHLIFIQFDKVFVITLNSSIWFSFDQFLYYFTKFFFKLPRIQVLLPNIRLGLTKFWFKPSRCYIIWSIIDWFDQMLFNWSNFSSHFWFSWPFFYSIEFFFYSIEFFFIISRGFIWSNSFNFIKNFITFIIHLNIFLNSFDLTIFSVFLTKFFFNVTKLLIRKPETSNNFEIKLSFKSHKQKKKSAQ